MGGDCSALKSSCQVQALNMAMRCSRSGSFSTRLSLLKTMVGRSLALNAGQCVAQPGQYS
jgi:hypothetical protein